MTDNQFDNIFRKRLEDHASKVPADMWERINKKDKEDKPFAKLPWLIIAFILLVAISGGVYYFGDNDNDKNAATGNTALVKEDEVKNNEATDKNKNEETATKNKSNNDNIHEDNNNDLSKTGNDGINKSDVTKTSKIGSQPGLTPLNNKAKSSDNAYKKNKKALQGYNKKKESNSDDNETSGYVTGIKLKKDNNEIANKSNTTNNIVTRGNSDTVNNNIDSAVLKSSMANKKNVDPDSLVIKPTIDQIPDDKFSFELFASPAIPVNIISADDKQYAQVLKDAGKMQFSYSLGLHLDIKFSNRLTGKIGIRYSRINEKMDFVDSTATGYNASYKNKFKSFDLPLLLSYSLKSKNRFTTCFTTGLLMSLTSNYTGAIPDNFGGSRDIHTQSVYKNNMGSALYFSMNWSKELNNKTDVFAEPFLTYRLNNMTDELQPFTQKIHTAGISIGLRYRLFKKED